MTVEEIEQNFLYFHEGMAKGTDMAAVCYAYIHDIKLISMPANWDRYGKSAGYIRNKEMAKIGDGLLLIWDGKSRGSANMKEEMKKINKPIW